ncbi:MAG TPA: long-chain fatty acid--CoA ligase [Geopsychrobacteraceae bacterium]|nr:long-chain fatty acid--CoA ligase [Geopsychrobacteraceae bacterium]
MSDTLPRMVLRHAERYGKKTAMRRKQDGLYQDISWSHLGEQIRAFGSSLIDMGLNPGDQAAIMSPNCPEWAYADLGIMSAGGRTVPVYHTESLKTILHILQNSQSRFFFTNSPHFARQLVQHLSRLPQLERIILLDGDDPHDHIMTLHEFLRRGSKLPEICLEKTLDHGSREEIATIVYTSGTTGEPKGAILTHGNILSNIEACCQLITMDESDECLSFLPLSHIFERMAGYYMMLYQGVVISYAESVDTVPANLLEVQPTVVISVPRLYEKTYNRILERVTTGPWLKKQIFFLALLTGKAHIARQQQGLDSNWAIKLTLKLFDRLVFSKIKERLGGKLRFFISGGAPLVTEIAEFFLAIGIPIYEGYGLTETSPVISVNYPGRHRIGSVGRPLNNINVKFLEDGELHVEGPSVFQGYWNQPEKTEQALKDHWFFTGDIGYLDKDNYLFITDRKKDLIVNAGGKNIAPLEVENMLKADKFVANVMVYGDRKPYLTALIVPDLEALQKYADYKNIDFLDHCDLVRHPQILNLIRRRIDHLQQKTPSYKQVKRFTLLSRDFSADEGEVTPTLKLKRKRISKNFATVLENIYREEGQAIHDTSFCVINSNKS